MRNTSKMFRLSKTTKSTDETLVKASVVRRVKDDGRGMKKFLLTSTVLYYACQTRRET